MRIRLKPRAMGKYLDHLQQKGLTMLRDTDKSEPVADLAAVPNEPTALQQVSLTFLCPPGFEPAAFLITAINKNGQPYTNAPTTQPHLVLHLATLAMNFASQVAIASMQRPIAKSAIITAPAGSVPPWNGPEGRV
jgi:hypothetical protein